jgi:hypothetical protein
LVNRCCIVEIFVIRSDERGIDRRSPHTVNLSVSPFINTHPSSISGGCQTEDGVIKGELRVAVATLDRIATVIPKTSLEREVTTSAETAV